MTVYIAKIIITHKVDGRTYQPGDEIDLSHLDTKKIKELVAGGVVEEKKGGTTTATKKKEVTDDGADN